MGKYLHLFIVYFILWLVPSSLHAQRNAEEYYKKGIEESKAHRCKEAINYFNISMEMDGSPKNKARCEQAIKNCTTPPPPPLSTYEKGVKAMRNKKYREAIRLFEKSMAEDKNQSNNKRCQKRIDECRYILDRIDDYDIKNIPVGNEENTTIFTKEDKIEPIEWNAEETLHKPIPYGGMWKIEKIEMIPNTNWIRAEKVLSEDGKASFLDITCSANEDTIKRRAKVWIREGQKVIKLYDFVDVIQFGNDTELDNPYPLNPKIESFTVDANGKWIVFESAHLPLTPKALIPNNNNWCQQLYKKPKKENFLSKLITQLFGGGTKLVPCDPNEIVIEVLPNNGNERWTKIPIEDSNVVIEIIQRRKK